MKNLVVRIILNGVFFMLLLCGYFPAMAAYETETNPKLPDNAVTSDYLKRNLSKKSPKLILTPQIEKEIRMKMKSDPLVQNYYYYLKNESDRILEKSLLTREL